MSYNVFLQRLEAAGEELEPTVFACALQYTSNILDIGAIYWLPGLEVAVFYADQSQFLVNLSAHGRTDVWRSTSKAP